MFIFSQTHYKSDRIAGRFEDIVVSPIAANLAAAVPALLPNTAPEVKPLPPG